MQMMLPVIFFLSSSCLEKSYGDVTLPPNHNLLDLSWPFNEETLSWIEFRNFSLEKIVNGKQNFPTGESVWWVLLCLPFFLKARTLKDMKKDRVKREEYKSHLLFGHKEWRFVDGWCSSFTALFSVILPVKGIWGLPLKTFTLFLSLSCTTDFNLLLSTKRSKPLLSYYFLLRFFLITKDSSSWTLFFFHLTHFWYKLTNTWTGYRLKTLPWLFIQEHTWMLLIILFKTTGPSMRFPWVTSFAVLLLLLTFKRLSWKISITRWLYKTSLPGKKKMTRFLRDLFCWSGQDSRNDGRTDKNTLEGLLRDIFIFQALIMKPVCGWFRTVSWLE